MLVQQQQQPQKSLNLYVKSRPGPSPGYEKFLNEGPSNFIKFLVENMYIEGLDPPTAKSKLNNTMPAPSQSPAKITKYSPRKIRSPRQNVVYAPYSVPVTPSQVAHIKEPVPQTTISPSNLQRKTPSPRLRNSPSPNLSSSPNFPASQFIQVAPVKSPVARVTPSPPGPGAKPVSPTGSKIILKPVSPSGGQTTMQQGGEFKRAAVFDANSLQGPRAYSNDMSDACKHQCAICSKHFGLTAMRTHSRLVHNMSVKEYQFKHGSIKENMSRIMWHKCQLCSEDFLLDSDEVHKHANGKHKMSLKEYNSRFLVLTLKKTSEKDESAPVDSEEPVIKQEAVDDDYGFLNL